MKKFAKEFKKFISKGNVLDLAVGIIIGSAFTAIVTALTDGILRPVINWVISLITAGAGIDTFYTFLKKAYVLDSAGIATTEIDLTKSIYIDWGALISAIINFILIAFVLFVILKAVNRAKEITDKAANLDKVIEAKTAKGLKLNRVEKKYIANKEEIERKKKEVEEKAKEEAAKLTKTEELLTEIRDALKNK